MNRRWLLALLGLVAASKVKAQTLIRRSQIYVPPAVTNNMINILRPPGAELLADLGSSLKLTRYTNPTRDELDVDWTKAPAQPQGLKTSLKSLTLIDGKYSNGENIPTQHLLFCNGLVQAQPKDYSINGNSVIPNPVPSYSNVVSMPLLDPTSDVYLIY